jgi:peptidoglycan DL-endopeptidase CwlO
VLAGLVVLAVGLTAIGVAPARAQPAPPAAPPTDPPAAVPPVAGPVPPPGPVSPGGPVSATEAAPPASAPPANATEAVPPANAPPANATEAAARLATVQREAEALTEQWHAAKDDLAARKAALGPLRAAVEPARAAVAAAHADEERFRVQIDAVALATFETGNLDQFNALLASGSAQDFIDQMSTLETVTAEQRAALDQLRVVVDRSARAQDVAAAAVARVQAAADAAAAAERELGTRKRDADARIDQAEQLLARLDPQQRRARLGPDESAPTGPITGTGLGVLALRAAQIQLGKPYRYGAEGPGSFDCSGLTMWAFKRAGVTLPRASRSQAAIGRAVSWDELQPGDLIFYYSPVSHVGIYAGDGKMINAPQTGDVVRYSTVSSRAFSGARRL